MKQLSEKTGVETSGNPVGSPAALSANSAFARKRPAARGQASADHVSASLRQAYQSTLDEEVPDEIMDLLRKLG